MSANLNQSNVVNNKFSINLLQPELFPKKVMLTLSRVVTIWLLVLLVMIGWAVTVHYEQLSLQQTLTTTQQTNSKLSAQVETLTTQLSNRKVDSELAEKLANVKLLMNNKQALHVKLTDPNVTYVAGFAKAMDELAQLHHQDIRLESININNNDMTFSGLALTPEAVPAWLAGFENSTLLSGKSFSQFKLSENEESITEFTVSSKLTEVSKP